MKKITAMFLLLLTLTACGTRPEPNVPTVMPEHPPEPVEIEICDPVERPTDATVPGTEEQWIDKAAEILACVGKEVPAEDSPTVTTETDEIWNQPELTVAFSNGMDVTFREDTADLIHISAFGQGQDSGTPMEEAEVLAQAQGYYEALPYPQGYEFHYVEKYDGQIWSFSFARPIPVTVAGEIHTVYNSYEEVRIVVDPCTGAFQLSNCFDRPLREGQGEPLTEQQALDALSQSGEVTDLDTYEITSSLGVCCPMDVETGYPQHADQCQLVWVLTLTDQPNSEGIEEIQQISIDLYTGEILQVSAS